ncbi:MAG: hypothetical protein JWO38_8195 [Gemmataceae bacterium]|nr:hypothetical protein [Gemmataceae bacterium]
MDEPRVFIWSGGQPRDPGSSPDAVDHLLALPPPAPLRRSDHIAYRWGDSTFDIHAAACSVRTTAWGTGHMTWLHCKATTAGAIAADATARLMTVLIPAHYVTRIEPGLRFRTARYVRSGDVGVFPPNRPVPADGLPLAEIERIMAELLSPELN